MIIHDYKKSFENLLGSNTTTLFDSYYSNWVLFLLFLEILGEMVNLQKVNWPNLPKSQLAKNTKHSILVILAQVDFLVSWLFGGWPFLLVSFWARQNTFILD